MKKIQIDDLTFLTKGIEVINLCINHFNSLQ